MLGDIGSSASRVGVSCLTYHSTWACCTCCKAGGMRSKRAMISMKKYDVCQTRSMAFRTFGASLEARGLRKCSTEEYSAASRGETTSGLMKKRHMIKLDRSMSTWAR